MLTMQGSEQQGIMPSVVISTDSMNSSLDRKGIIPFTTSVKESLSRVLTEFNSLG